MQHPNPTCYWDIATDGVFPQADADAALSGLVGGLDGARFACVGPGQFTVTFNKPGQSPRIFAAAQVATITPDKKWHWTTNSAANQAFQKFGFAELDPTVTRMMLPHDLAAARTLHGSTPAFIVDLPTGEEAVIVLVPPVPSGGTRQALVTGTSALTADMDLSRALTGLASIRGIDVQITDDGHRYTFSDGVWALTGGTHNQFLADIAGGSDIGTVATDAAFLSLDRQLWYDAMFPDPHVELDLDAGIITIDNPGRKEPLIAPASVIATVTAKRWLWSWADPNINTQACTKDTKLIYDFGVSQGIPPFIKPDMPLQEANYFHLKEAPKPICHLWTDVIVPVSHDISLIVYVDHPDLVPATTRDAVATVLRHDLPVGLDARRAVTSFARMKGLSTTVLSPEKIQLSTGHDTTVTVTFDTDGTISVVD